MGERANKRGKRIGFSTGTAAAAAAKAALRKLLGVRVSENIRVNLPEGRYWMVPIEEVSAHGPVAEGRVIKDGGDDPDVTHRAEIGALVRLLNGTSKEEYVRFIAGEGVGKATKPGLPVPVGEPAINPVPRQIITQALREVWVEAHASDPLRVDVEIFAPRGKELALKTLNPRRG
ncbi:MAG: cobalt-precorrin-5B (C(1))-methyltransferase, partial [Candidatus Odinarchaeota archaeon]